MLSGIAFLGMFTLLMGIGASNLALAQDPLVIIQGTEPPGLDPTLHREGPTYSVTINLFDSLLRKTRDGQNVPALAESFERDTDTSWLFDLRPGVRFHNGEPLTAAAVKFTIDRIFDPELESTRASDMKWIASVEIIDDLTVRIVANEPFALAEHFFTELQIVPPNHVTEVGDVAFDEMPVGTGPFELVRWNRGNQIVLQRNEDYWDGPAEVEEVAFRFINSAASRVATLLSGDADLITDPPITARQQIDNNPNTRFESATGTRVVFVGLDTVQESPLENVLVRQAMNHAIDKVAILDNLLGGFGEQTTTLLTSQDLGFNPDVDPYPYDPDRAMELLADAGYPDGFEITMDMVNGRFINDTNVGQAIAGFLEEVGITVTLNVLEFGAFNGAIFSHQSSPMYFASWGNPVFDPAFIFDFITRTEGLLRTIEDPEIDDLLNRASSTTDQALRRDLYNQVMPLINEAAPAIFLYKQPVLFGMSERLDWEPRSDEFLLMHDARFK
jgi:peptide/nickel transport system substrate-binding protein